MAKIDETDVVLTRRPPNPPPLAINQLSEKKHQGFWRALQFVSLQVSPQAN